MNILKLKQTAENDHLIWIRIQFRQETERRRIFFGEFLPDF